MQDWTDVAWSVGVVVATILLVWALSGCSPVLEGPAADVQQVVQPTARSEISAPSAPQPPSGPPPRGNFFRAWVPRQSSERGEVVEGHWVELSTTPPALETLEPERPMPRAPKTLPTKQIPAAHQAPRPLGTRPQGVPQQPPPQGYPGVPPSLGQPGLLNYGGQP